MKTTCACVYLLCMCVRYSYTLFLCSRVFPDKEAMLAGALEMAGEIAGRSPVAVQGTKVNLIYSRDHSVAEGLNYMVSEAQYLQGCSQHHTRHRGNNIGYQEHNPVQITMSLKQA